MIRIRIMIRIMIRTKKSSARERTVGAPSALFLFLKGLGRFFLNGKNTDTYP